MSLTDLLAGKQTRPTKPHREAHFVEEHFVHPKLSWDEAAKAVQSAFPKKARLDRPTEWYRMLVETHWPGRVLPGNGPFYLPAWLWDDDDLDAVEKALKGEGFIRVEAHVKYLPPSGEYLSTIMRAAEDLPWNANPITFRGYIYTERKIKKGELRPFNVTPREGW